MQFLRSALTGKQCDLVQPACQRCQYGKLHCEGYERYPVFINKTARGLQKRQHLEEVKLRGGANPERPSCAPVTSSPSAKIAIPRMLLEAAYRSWVLGLVGEVAIVKHGMRSQTFWLRHVLEHLMPLPILQQALYAIACTGHGKTYGDATFLEHGHRLYGGVLQKFKESLSDPLLVHHEDVLATAGLLVLYEVGL
jgi:hypothetical protein